MKNIITAAFVAASVLALASCGDQGKAKKQPIDSTSTTVIDSSTKTTTVIDSTKHDTVKIAEKQKNTGKRQGSNADPASMSAMRDSIRKDSAKLSRK
jgi:predicted small lipoprotein YifL